MATVNRYLDGSTVVMKLKESIRDSYYDSAEVDKEFKRRDRMMRAYKWKSAIKRKR